MSTFIIKLNRKLNDNNYQNNQVSNQSTKLKVLCRETKKKNKLKNCTWCEMPVEQFKDQISVKEYLISGLCQNCQDKTFGKVE